MKLNYFANVPNFLPGLISFLILLAIVFIILSFASLFFKKRSTISGIMFILTIGAVSFFLISTELDGETIGDSIIKLGVDYGIGLGIYGALSGFAAPVANAHAFFISMLTGIFGVENTDSSLSFVNSGIFVLIIYVVLFVLSFIFFNRKKKTTRIYSDYLS